MNQKEIWKKVFGQEWRECVLYITIPPDALCYGQDVKGIYKDKCKKCPVWGKGMK